MAMVWIVLLAGCAADAMRIATAAPKEPVIIVSPSGRITATLTTDATTTDPNGEAKANALHLRIAFDGEPVLAFLGLGVRTLELGEQTAGFVVRSVTACEHDETYAVPVGKSGKARNHFCEATVSLVQSDTNRRLDLIVRAYDDGVAYRYILPAQAGVRDATIITEPVTLTLEAPETTTAHVTRFRDYTTHAYEGLYEHLTLDDFSGRDLIGLPVLFERRLPEVENAVAETSKATSGGRVWAAVTEAALVDHAGWYLKPVSDEPGSFRGLLSPWPGETMTKVVIPLLHASPWRVVMLSDDIGKLVESNLVLNLNPPSIVTDPSWIRPGPTTFPWWNGFAVGDDVGFEPGLNTAMMKHYIDFCATNDIPYHSLDGIHGQAWYGGPIRPYEGDDITTGREGFDFQEIIRHANEKGVRLRLWLHWEAAALHMEEAFSLYEKWGVEGVMIDFMNRDDQHMVAMYHRLLQLAAKHHLTVTLHGAYKPTGIERTYPHLLNREAVYNLEYDKSQKVGVTPRHELTVPFVRMLAGPLDFHQGGFRGVAPEDFVPRSVAPIIMGTRCHQLATYVVYQNHMPMLADYPAAYEGQSGFELIATMPATWDETRVLHAEVGEAVTIARRSGDVWYVGSMSGDNARSWRVRLDFLDSGRFEAEVFADTAAGVANPDALVQTTRTVTGNDTLKVDLGIAGGQVVKLCPAGVR